MNVQTELKASPDGCQEASPLSGERYIPCNRPATRIIQTGDPEPYRMCDKCAHHNVRNRRATDLGPYEPTGDAEHPRTHNAPPEPMVLTPQRIYADLELANISLTARRDELIAAVGRVPEEVTDETEGRVIDFIKQINACASKAKDAFKTAKEPYLEGGRAVDGFFKKITEPLDQAKKTLNDRLTAHLRRKEAAERARREEAERVAREAALKAQREAEEAARKLAEESQLTDAIAKEDAAKQAAADAQKAAREAEAKAAELSRSRGEYGGVSSLRTEWVGELTDRKVLDLEVLRDHLPVDGLEKAVRAFVKAGGRELRGARIYERTSAVTR